MGTTGRLLLTGVLAVLLAAMSPGTGFAETPSPSDAPATAAPTVAATSPETGDTGGQQSERPTTDPAERTDDPTTDSPGSAAEPEPPLAPTEAPSRKPGRSGLVLEVNSSAFASAQDANVGDGICATSTGACTLRAALQEANHSGNATVTVADAWGGGVIKVTSYSATDWMYTGALTGATGAFFLLTGANVTVDLKHKLSITSTYDGGVAFYVNGANAVVKNAKDVFAGETSFEVGPGGTGAVLTDLDLRQANTGYYAERAVVLRSGAHDVTIEDSVFSGYYTGAVAEGTIEIAASASLSNLLIRGNTFTNDQTTSTCSTTNARGCRRAGIVAGASASVAGFRIIGNTFANHDTIAASPIRFQSSTGITLSNLEISGNEFLNQSTGGADGTYYPSTITLPYGQAMGGSNSIHDNRFVSATAKTAFAIVWWGGQGAANNTVDSNLSIRDNDFDGYSQNGAASTSTIRLYLTGIVTVERNTFGPNTVALTTSTSETSINAGLYANYSNAANRKIGTWYPSAVAVPTGSVCTVQVTVAGPNGTTTPTYPARLDFYYTRGSGQGAEELIGSRTVSSDPAGKTFEFDWVSRSAGTIRIQSHGTSPSSRLESSQYSRQVAVAKDACGPKVTVEQAAGQHDPTFERPLHFVVTTSEKLATTGNGALATGDFDLSHSTAPRVRVTSLTQQDDTTYLVVVRADDSGLVVLRLPAGAVTDPDGNASAASTSTDNEITYRNPLTRTPAQLIVHQDAAPGDVTISRTTELVPTAEVRVVPALDNGWVSATEGRLGTGGAATTTVQVTAGDLQGAQRTSTLSLSVVSDDPNFDGLLLPDVEVTAQRAAIQITKQAFADPGHSRELPSGSIVTNGQLIHWVYTVRNLGDVAVSGVTVTDDNLPPGSHPDGIVCADLTVAAGGTASCTASAEVFAD